MDRELRILFLARSFPPGASIAAVRARHLVTHLARLGCRIEVVTVDPRLLVNPGIPWNDALGKDRVRIRYTGHSMPVLLPGYLRSPSWWSTTGMDRLAQGLARRLNHDSGRHWISHVQRSCEDLKPGDVDLVLATAPPWPAFDGGARIARRLGCPYVLDYRDSWTLSPHGSEVASDRHLEKERRLLRAAGAAVTVSPSMAQGMLETFRPSCPVLTITNGFDPVDFESVRKAVFDTPALVYAGNVYPPKRTLAPVLTVLARLRAQGFPHRLHYYGHAGAHVREMADREQVMDRVIDHGPVSREEALAATAGATAAVVVTSVEQKGTVWDKSIVTGKIFEALGLRTPILLIAPEDSDARSIVMETKSGHCFHGGEVAEMVDALTGDFGSKCEFQDIERYSWSRLAAEYRELLLRVMADHIA